MVRQTKRTGIDNLIRDIERRRIDSRGIFISDRSIIYSGKLGEYLRSILEHEDKPN